MSRLRLVLVGALLPLAAGGCGGRSPAPAARGTREAAVSEERPTADRPVSRPSRDKMLAGALAVLDRLDDFDEARGAELVFDRLNQWSQASNLASQIGADAGDWRPDPLLETLPEGLRSLATADALESPAFTLDGDVVFLRDQRWLADIARIVRGGAVDDLDVAERLFRWTVRSLALGGDPPMVPTAATPGTRWFLPGEILLAGRASGPQRAWIFLQLLRHAGLDGVMLATGDRSTGRPRPWVPAAVIDGEAYLFEPVYGMPIPGPGGVGIATVRQAAADPAVLASLSLPERPYPLGPRDMQGLSILVAADPWSLARRTHLLDRHVRAAREMRVAVHAARIAAAGRAALPGRPVEAEDDGAAEPAPEPSTGLWEFPWETLARRQREAAAVQAALRRELAPLELPAVAAAGLAGSEARPPVRPLLAARIREFRGDLDGPAGAKAAYMAARPGRDALRAALAGVPEEQAVAIGGLYRQMKEDATYWLGVLTLAEGEDATAAEYLGRMTLEAAPDSRWADAARANLAQALIGLGRTPEAIALLRADQSPQRFGSRVLANRLEAAAKAPRPEPRNGP
jgi:hypothetical protein